MKFAIAQFSPQWEQKEMNMEKAEKWVLEAAQQQADYIFFPELSLTGFSMNISKIMDEQEETIEFVRSCALNYKIGIGIGYVPFTRDKGKNSYLIIDQQGKQVLNYEKIHPFSFAHEDDYFQGGTQIACGMLCNSLEEIPLGIGICYDLRFPEVFRALAKQSHLIIIPANWPKARIEQWKILLKARAIENQAYVMGINCVGNIGGVLYSGESMFIDPLGRVISEAEKERDKEQETIIYVKMDDNVEALREKFPVLADQKSIEFWTTQCSSQFKMNRE